jgi:hypothetical protein
MVGITIFIFYLRVMASSLCIASQRFVFRHLGQAAR